MKLEVHILSHDGEHMLEWALRHYRSLGRYDYVRIIVHDGGPNHTQQHIIALYDAQWLPWDTAGELNDELARHLKNTCWKGTDADWVIVVDADELIYFPEGIATLDRFEAMGACVIKPQGFEMFSDEWHEAHFVDEPSGYSFGREGQIYDWVKDGAPDDKWYSKPVLFSARRVAESGLGIGAHESRPILKSGRSVFVNKDWPKAKPPVYLLHFHQIGPIERVAARYDATRERLSAVNVDRRYGNFDPGLKHAQDKRALIMPRLRKVIAS